jgi:hypothetical protein
MGKNSIGPALLRITPRKFLAIERGVRSYKPPARPDHIPARIRARELLEVLALHYKPGQSITTRQIMEVARISHNEAVLRRNYLRRRGRWPYKTTLTFRHGNCAEGGVP